MAGVNIKNNNLEIGVSYEKVLFGFCDCFFGVMPHF